MSAKDTKTDRRAFLKFAGLGSVAAGAAMAGGGQAEAADVETRPATPGYRETEHVKAFYETARF